MFVMFLIECYKLKFRYELNLRTALYAVPWYSIAQNLTNAGQHVYPSAQLGVRCQKGER